MFEKGTNAPFIMVGNSVGKKGVQSNSMFEFIDIYPTLAELMNLKNIPDYLEGKSFAGVVEDPDMAFRTEVRALTRRGETTGWMVKNKEWRYVEWDDGTKGRELYDQKNDPIEYNNLAEDPQYAGVVKEMKNLLNQ